MVDPIAKKQKPLPTVELKQCQICKKPKKLGDLVPAELVRPPVAEIIQKEYPEWSLDGFICLPDLHRYRGVYFEDILATDRGQLSALEEEVVRSLQEEEELISQNLNIEFARQLTLGERVADRVAEFGGSWLFIGLFTAVLLIWIALNSAVYLSPPFD